VYLNNVLLHLLIHVRVYCALSDWLYAHQEKDLLPTRNQENAVLREDVYLPILMLVPLLYLNLEHHAVENFTVLTILIAAVGTIVTVIVNTPRSPNVMVANGRL
jgi:hypothetical protein